MNATPTKRRALGSLDVNISRSPRSPSSTKLAATTNNKGLLGLGGGSPLKKKTTTTTTTTTGTGSNNNNNNNPTKYSNNSLFPRRGTPSPSRKGTTSPAKRPLLSVLSDEKENEDVLLLPAAKKLCSDAKVLGDAGRAKVDVEDADEDEPVPASQASARRSISPDASSLFDTPSVINTSQLTNITEPDTEAPAAPAAVAPAPAAAPAPRSQTAPTTTSSSILDTLASRPPPRPRRVPTREEFRQKAEILKLRLSLATYKVKTNQTDVPLDKLQIRPVPGMARPRTPLPSMSAHTIERATPVQYWYRSCARRPSSFAPLGGRGSHRTPRVRDDDDNEDDDDEMNDGPERGDASAAEGDVDEEGLPTLSPSDAALTTPRKKRSEADEEKLTSSGLRGGAAKGLLSLSQGSH